jgi:DNA repair exonuclease SbcCD ATPase subunit
MSEDITQWLEEIKSLKQKISELEQDLDTAQASADSWRQLYNTEAQQRRIENKSAQQQMAALKEQVRQLPGGSLLVKANNPIGELRAEAAALDKVEDLQLHLSEVLEERDRLFASLKLEQDNHAQTRKSLTAVIGDTVDQLTRERRQVKD